VKQNNPIMAAHRLAGPFARFGRWLLRGPRRAHPASWPRRLTTALARGLVAITLASILSVSMLRWIPPVTTAFVLRERIVGQRPVAHEWTRWEDIHPNAALAVVAAEDQRFLEHHGFDFEQIRQALSEDRRRGASTISQQVAKNLYLWPGGGFFRKGLEAGFTVLIEALWPKRRVLEVYLNVAEFGPGVFGVGAASRQYFGKAPADLGPAEAARLAAVLPGPKRMSVERPSSFVRRRTAEILRQMELLGGTRFVSGL